MSHRASRAIPAGTVSPVASAIHGTRGPGRPVVYTARPVTGPARRNGPGAERRGRFPNAVQRDLTGKTITRGLQPKGARTT